MRREPSIFMPPDARTIIAPEGGWKEDTLYTVEVAFSPFNPVHFAMFFSGYLNDGVNPGGYNELTNPTWDDKFELKSMHYLKVVAELPEEFQIYRHAEEDWVDG